MKQVLTVVAILALVASSAACFKHTYTVGAGAPEGEIVYRHWHHHWILGLVRPELQKQLDVNKFCPSGDVTIHQETSFANGLVGALTWGLYAPTTVTLRCADGEEAEVALQEEAVERIARDPRFLEFVAEVAPQRLAEAQAAVEQQFEVQDEDELLVAPR